MENQIYERLKRHYNYVYWCKEKAPGNQASWWTGYMECLEFILQMVRALRKEQRK